MDPVTLGVMAAVGSAVTAAGSAAAMQAQGQADRQRAAMEGAWAERRAGEERATAQRAASEEMRKASLAQSRLTALAGASGSGTDDPTVMSLFGDIEREGQYNAQVAQTQGEMKATGMEYQSAIDQWAADRNAKIKSRSAATTLIGGLLGSAGQMQSGMAGRYRQPGYTQGYGRYS